MKMYSIYLQNSEAQYECVGVVDATNLDEVFKLTQNDWYDSSEHADGWNEGNPCRSTMVGDIFVEFDHETHTKTAYQVDMVGFSIVEDPMEKIYPNIQEIADKALSKRKVILDMATNSAKDIDMPGGKVIRLFPN